MDGWRETARVERVADAEGGLQGAVGYSRLYLLTHEIAEGHPPQIYISATDTSPDITELTR